MKIRVFALLLILPAQQHLFAAAISDSSPLQEKAAWLQEDLLNKHWLNGLYVSIVPASSRRTSFPHTVDEPGNVIHAGVWTGRYLAGVGYQYAVTRDPKVRRQGGEILAALRILQEVTGKPGLLARGYVTGHGPVEEWERDGRESPEWHQGQGKYAGYRWHGDVSVDNFNAVLYGYAVYHDLAADAAQRRLISEDVNRLMTHLLENHCRIVDVDGDVTLWGHVGMDPDPARDDYYRNLYTNRFKRALPADGNWQPPLRASLMLLPDLLIAHRITGDNRYREFYERVVARYRNNPDRLFEAGPFSLERLARVNHSSEGQSYEALYNLIRYEKNPDLQVIYRKWVNDLWEMNWMEGNSLFSFMTRALLPEYRAPRKPGLPAGGPDQIPHGIEAARMAVETLRLYPLDRVMHPVMNSNRPEIERNPFSRGEALAARPLPINERPLDNEYAWKGNPYQLDGWFKPILTGFQAACDDKRIEWFSDNAGRFCMTRDGGATWQEMTAGLRGARVQAFAASTNRTFVLHALTDQGIFITRDGGFSWRPAAETSSVKFPKTNFGEWQTLSNAMHFRISEAGELLVSRDGGKTGTARMKGWKIPRASAAFATTRGIVASGPGGCYESADGENWRELKLWRDNETGAADFLHAYWMGRYYGYISKGD